MKYAAVVLFNNKNPLSAVDYGAVTDALLSGGIFLDEVVFIPYDAPSRLTESLSRLSAECDGIYVVCDRALFVFARDAIADFADGRFTEEYLLETESCLYAVMPSGQRGAEIARTETVPRTDKRRGKRYLRMVLKLVSAPSERIRRAVQAAQDAAEGKLFLHTGGGFGETRLEIVYDQNTPKVTADEVLRILVSELGEYLYALEDVTLPCRLVETLKLRRMKVATAESFTAGRVGSAIVSVPGASAVFYEGLNTYSNESKRERVGVSEYTLKSKGAVSSDTAYEMAAGLVGQGKCDLAVATTGIAGPTADGTEKPVGLCYIAIGTKERVRVFRFQLDGDRETVTKTAVNLALFLAYREIK